MGISDRKNPPQAAGIHPGRLGGFLVISGFSPSFLGNNALVHHVE
jgi:hypothetical protein